MILRNVIENPSWYTPYTPYQAEVAQGRLEALLTFQTAVKDLTGMDVANASLLDEPTAAAEAMTMLRRVQTRRTASANVFLVSARCFPQTLEVLASRAEPLGIELRVVEPSEMTFDEHVFGTLVQYPDGNGQVEDVRDLIGAAHAAGVLVAVATDLLSLTMLTPPGEMGGTSWWATPSGWAFRWDMADRTRRSLPPARPSSGRFSAGASSCATSIAGPKASATSPGTSSGPIARS